MTGVNFEMVWGAMPYPALVLAGDDTIRAANPAAESFGAISFRQMEGRPLGKYLGEDSAVLDVVRQIEIKGLTTLGFPRNWLQVSPALQRKRLCSYNPWIP